MEAIAKHLVGRKGTVRRDTGEGIGMLENNSIAIVYERV